ncbi:MAG TPA: hypothetical protein DF383_12770 [Deltaproteobacteria bacterium]|nr:hypothetical protein [Deltaproteobacteria bacterium]
MRAIKSVGIKDLKNNLSAYLREVKQGARLLITERNSVVAEIREPLAKDSLSPAEELREQWIRERKLTPRRSTKKIKKYPRSPLRQAEGTAQALLQEDRGT